MTDSLIKHTSLGLISIEIHVDGDGPTIPTSEVHDLIALLYETAHNLETALNSHVKKELLPMHVSHRIH